MKKLIALTTTLLLTASIASAESPTEGDQKWLQVVEKKITESQPRISTPSEARLALLKDWASTKGYTLNVTKSESNYRVEVTRSFAQK